MGYTAQHVAGVWVGNDDGAAMKRVAGGGLPAQIWRRIMMQAHEGLPVATLPGGWRPSLARRAPAAGENASAPQPEGLDDSFLKRVLGRLRPNG